jgi:hypothetical protein
MNWFGNRGWAHPRPGTVQSMNCGVCGESMEVTRNVKGSTSFAEAIGKKGHVHDSFRCQHYRKDWHRRVSALMDEGRATKSESIRKVLQKEIEDILQRRKP